MRRDVLFGFSIWSEAAAVVLGLLIMTSARWLRSMPDTARRYSSQSGVRLLNRNKGMRDDDMEG